MTKEKESSPLNVWLFDLLLTAASFLLAYRFRSLFEVEGHTVMPVRVYLWLLAIILPTWAILLPFFGVYSEPALRPLHQILRLSKAIGFAWLVMLAVQFFVNQDQTNRLIVLFTLVINYLLLVSYRVILFEAYETWRARCASRCGRRSRANRAGLCPHHREASGLGTETDRCFQPETRFARFWRAEASTN